MTVMYWTGAYPWWDDNSLSKPSKTYFNTQWGKMTYLSGDGGWVKESTAVITQMDYNSATLQIGNWTYPSNNNTYFAINLNEDTSNNEGWWYFFIDSIDFDNLSTNPTATIRLRLDHWATCIANISSDFSTWQTQVLATNKEVNLYDYWSKCYNNLSSFTWLRNVYPQLSNIQLIKYSCNQYTYQESGSNWDDGYFYYKISFQVSAYNNSSSSSQQSEHLAGNLKDYYVVYNSNNSNTVSSNLQSTYFTSTEFLPFIAFADVEPMTSQQNANGVSAQYYGNQWTIPFLLSFSTDKDIGLIQLPFNLYNKGLIQAKEYYITGNDFINPNGNYYTYEANGKDYSFPTYWDGGVYLSDVWDVLVGVNGCTINDFYLADVSNWSNDNSFLSIFYKNGFSTSMDSEPWDFTSLGYCLTPAMIMYPMLFNYYSYNISYMGQQVSYTSKYVNSVENLFPFNGNGVSNPHPLIIKFNANYPNLSLNVYAQDNIIDSSNTPIGQINLSTAMLPNTTNPSATFETNERKIINNSATLKNLDLATAGLSFAGGLGLNSLLNPLSLFTGAVNMGLDMDKINLNYSNSFGSAKMFELGHQNTLQTAGDNLGNPANELTYWQEVVSLNDLQNIVAMIDKYGYPYNQWDRFSNLFGNYYHNYIKLSQNADLLVNENAILLLKDWQNYLIQQFISGVVIWEHDFNGVVNFMDTWQLYNDCMNGAYNYGDLKNWDTHYRANFKYTYQTSMLMSFKPQNLEGVVIRPETKQSVLNQKETPLNKGLAKKGSKIGWKKL